MSRPIMLLRAAGGVIAFQDPQEKLLAPEKAIAPLALSDQAESKTVVAQKLPFCLEQAHAYPLGSPTDYFNTSFHAVQPQALPILPCKQNQQRISPSAEWNAFQATCQNALLGEKQQEADVLQSLFKELSSMALLDKRYQRHSTFFPKETAAINQLIDQYWEAYQALEEPLQKIMRYVGYPAVGESESVKVPFSECERKAIEKALETLVQVTTQINELSQLLDQNPYLNHLSFVISTISVFASLLSAISSFVGFFVQLAIPPLLPLTFSLAMACASGVAHLGNTLYEVNTHCEREEWQTYRKSLEAFTHQLQRFKDSVMWSAMTQQIDQVQSSLQQGIDAQRQNTDAKIKELEEKLNASVPREEFEQLKELILATRDEAKQIAIQAKSTEGIASCEELKQTIGTLVETRFGHGLTEKTVEAVKEDIRAQVEKVLGEVLAAKKQALENAQHTHQENLTAAKQGN